MHLPGNQLVLSETYAALHIQYQQGVKIDQTAPFILLVMFCILLVKYLPNNKIFESNVVPSMLEGAYIRPTVFCELDNRLQFNMTITSELPNSTNLPNICSNVFKGKSCVNQHQKVLDACF